MKRISRACLTCRQRKSKCDLDNRGPVGAPPCQRCVRNGVQCVLGGSQRGGRRVRKNINHDAETSTRSTVIVESTSPQLSNGTNYERAFAGVSPASAAFESHQDTGMPEAFSDRLALGGNDITPSVEDTLASTNLHDTADTLNFLSQVAVAENATQRLGRGRDRMDSGFSSQMNHIHQPIIQSPLDGQYMNENILPYCLVLSGLLTTEQVAGLVSRFAKLYHPYLPIAPRSSLQPSTLHDVARYEPHLLTAMITVAAKDLQDGTEILQICSTYMNELISAIAGGKRCDVEAVEALLLLAEWEPQGSLSNTRDIGCGEEDQSAWMHVGLALRLGYFLRLDRTSFKNDDEEKMIHFNRRRLAWAGEMAEYVSCYISDRQISVRIGRGFWARGPGPVPVLDRQGFPSLQPQSAEEDNYASIMQANMELTQLYSNVHDVLYSGMGSSMKMMLVGSYVKHIDDFRMSINRWKSIWGTLTCSPNMKSTLQMSFEYLRLYTNAYAFQATTCRAISSRYRDPQDKNDQPLVDVGSLPDARFIYESVDAAKSLLTIVNNYVDPETSLRHFPLRFSLYCVNSAVFLYKAWSLGILNNQEKSGVRSMISEFTRRLRKGSVRPTDFGSRYSQLLELLWQRTDDTSGRGSSPISPTNMHSGAILASLPEDDFSWLDLQAVGDFLSGEQVPADFDFGAENVQQFMQASRRGSVSWNDMGWPVDNDMNHFF